MSELQTWDDVIHDRRIRPGGGYAALAESLAMDRSRLTAILRGRATPAERSYKGEVPEIDRVAKEFRLTKANVRRISTNTRVKYLEGLCDSRNKTKRTFGRVR
jgi:hypothetical protein